jgi:hypothetical protein
MYNIIKYFWNGCWWMWRRQEVWKLIGIFSHVRLSKEQFSAQNSLHFHSEVRIVYRRQQLHHKEAEEAYNCNCFDFQSVQLLNFCRYPLPVFVVTCHFFCLWCDNSRWVLWYCFPWQWVTECSIRAYITLSDLSYISWQTYTWESTVKHFLTWTYM